MEDPMNESLQTSDYSSASGDFNYEYDSDENTIIKGENESGSLHTANSTIDPSEELEETEGNTGRVNQDVDQTVQEQTERKSINLEALLAFYGPAEIPYLVFISAGAMLYYDQGKRLHAHWDGGVYGKIVLFFLGIFICGFVLITIQLAKLVGMLVNKFVWRSLYLADISVRHKSIFGMIGTKIGAAIWTTQTAELVCNNRFGRYYSSCVERLPFKISSFLVEALSCEHEALCRGLLYQLPMIFFAIFAYWVGKYLLPTVMRSFRKREILSIYLMQLEADSKRST